MLMYIDVKIEDCSFMCPPEDPLRYDSCWADSVGGGGGAAADSCLEGVAAAAADGTAGGRATLFTSQLVYRSGGGHGTGGRRQTIALV